MWDLQRKSHVTWLTRGTESAASAGVVSLMESEVSDEGSAWDPDLSNKKREALVWQTRGETRTDSRPRPEAMKARGRGGQCAADPSRTGWTRRYANNRARRRVPPDAARRIQQLVLAHRKPVSFLNQWETKPGLRERSLWWRMTAPE